MEKSKRVVAVMAIRPLPESRAAWLEAWKGLREHALRMPGCRSFRVLADRHDPGSHFVMSEWEHEADFDAFVREGGLMWLERGIDNAKEPLVCSVLEDVTGPSNRATASDGEPIAARR